VFLVKHYKVTLIHLYFTLDT